jgi:copper(I)-binding protein
MKAPLLLAAALLAAACARTETSGHEGSTASDCRAAEGGAVTLEKAWVRAQSDASSMSAAYFTVCNGTLDPVTIAGLSTPAAGIVELHETTRDANGIVGMGPTGPITLAPGEAAVFEPGGKHAMLMSLPAAIDEGSTTSLTLELAGGATVTAEAKAVSATEAAAHEH